MMQATLQFDPIESSNRKARGKDWASVWRYQALEKAQEIAKQISMSGRGVTADDVQEAMIGLGYSPAVLGNAAGSIFRGRQWMAIGWAPSERISNHGRFIRVWRLIEQGENNE